MNYFESILKEMETQNARDIQKAFSISEEEYMLLSDEDIAGYSEQLENLREADEKKAIENAEKTARKKLEAKILNKIPLRFREQLTSPLSTQGAKIYDRLMKGESAIVYSPLAGTGKTQLAYTFYYNYSVAGHTGAVEKARDIFSAYKASYGGEDISAYVNKLYTIDFLVIDEVDKNKMSVDEVNNLFAIIDGRYEDMLQTILIGNFESSAEIEAVLGDTIVSRLYESGGIYQLNDKQWRARQ